MIRTCVICGTEIEHRHCRENTCSARCSRELRSSLGREYYSTKGQSVRTCSICGSLFRSGVTEKTCSLLCQGVHNKKARARTAEYTRQYQAERTAALRLFQEIKAKGLEALL